MTPPRRVFKARRGGSSVALYRTAVRETRCPRDRVIVAVAIDHDPTGGGEVTRYIGDEFNSDLMDLIRA